MDTVACPLSSIWGEALGVRQGKHFAHAQPENLLDHARRFCGDGHPVSSVVLERAGCDHCRDPSKRLEHWVYADSTDACSTVRAYALPQER